MRRAVATATLALAACASGEAPPGGRGSAGTPTDPVARCSRIADVCRLDGSRLGVCTSASAVRCAGVTPCFVCTSQH